MLPDSDPDCPPATTSSDPAQSYKVSGTNLLRSNWAMIELIAATAATNPATGSDHWATYAEMAGVLTATVIAVPALWKAVQGLRRMWRGFFETQRMIVQINAEFSPNGGMTLKDQVNRIEQGQIKTKAQVLQLLNAAPNLSIGYFETDAKGGCSYVSRGWTEMTGLAIEQARGRGWMAALHPEDRQRVANELEINRQQGIGYATYDYRLRHVISGKITHVQGVGERVVDSHGTPIGWVGSLSPVTNS